MLKGASSNAGEVVLSLGPGSLVLSQTLCFSVASPEGAESLESLDLQSIAAAKAPGHAET